MNQETTGFFVGPSNQLRNVDLSLTPIPPVYTHPSCLSSFFFPSSSFSRHFSGVVAVESSVRSFLWPVRVVLPIQSVFVLWRVLLLLLALSLSLCARAFPSCVIYFWHCQVIIGRERNKQKTWGDEIIKKRNRSYCSVVVQAILIAHSALGSLSCFIS